MTAPPVRPFAAAVDAFRAIDPKVREQKPPHYAAVSALSAEDLEGWPSDPPLASLYLMKDPAQYAADVFTNIKSLVSYFNFGAAVGTWNANGEAKWDYQEGSWILAEVDLIQEQAGDDWDEDGGGSVYAIFALWRVEEGWAAAVWRPSQRAALARVMGLGAWPALSREDKVWYGE